MWLPDFAGLVDSRFHAIPQNIPLELRKHGQHTGQRLSMASVRLRDKRRVREVLFLVDISV